ncbi:MAG TPA: hypothetical protein VF094_11470 [Gaiellaceae bacterium]
MEIDLDPAQPEAVVRAVSELVAPSGPAADPWWQAGVDEALGPADDGRLDQAGSA